MGSETSIDGHWFALRCVALPDVVRRGDMDPFIELASHSGRRRAYERKRGGAVAETSLVTAEE